MSKSSEKEKEKEKGPAGLKKKLKQKRLQLLLNDFISCHPHEQKFASHLDCSELVSSHARVTTIKSQRQTKNDKLGKTMIGPGQKLSL